MIARLSILILSKSYPSGDNYLTNSRHDRLFDQWVLLLKSNKEYVLTFNILAQVLVDYSFINEQGIARISCEIQLININIDNIPS
jgi:hypothetical protein